MTALRKLALMEVFLSDCKRTWFTYLDLCHLKELVVLEHCPGAATPRLHSLKMVHDVSSTRGDHTTHALEDLLTSPKHTLRTLNLSIRNATGLPSVATIRSHGKTLKRLLLDVSGRNDVQNNGWSNPRASKYELTYDASQFSSFLRSCGSLRELVIAIPEIGLEYENFEREGGEFPNRVVSVTS